VFAPYVAEYAMSGDVVLTGLTSKPRTGNADYLARYDVDLGGETWRSLIPPTQGEPKTGVAVDVVAVGFAPDGQHAYGVYNRGALQQDLFEVDLTTGEQTGRWPKIDDKVLGADWYVDGDLVVGVLRKLYLHKEVELVVKQAG